MDKIICPYCKESQGLITINDNTIYRDILNCRKCEKSFVVIGNVYWEYTTKKIEGEE